ncbi:endonuclease/exonuclease/phosphatase family protein [Mycolicibacterium sp. S2-37]|uniref:endonuclease/exonuclease/phosphatase family protein n=1 Tax=Mycolicibacterium sp. S2-37 TaxID=2810297 RepID=UPI001A944FDD|nr:endonuclease/exonuclease/phosphatase family protein [Mycolicibacterium sp. S2-37]MBO0678639.1 endonuclease/exonuclease/phosphatase family protein [Mycolicibacterium sp. S2-37]
MRRRRRTVPVGRPGRPGGGEAVPVGRDQLTLATFNIWFSDYHAEQRFRAIADLLSLRMPDVVALQEVTPAALDIFTSQEWIAQHYHRAAVVGDDVGTYGMALLSRLPLTDVTYTRLPTRLSRGFLQARCAAGGGELVVCNIHLDSGKRSARLRVRQLRRIFGSLRRAGDAVVLGDFNMRDRENDRITAPYRDVWPTLRPGDAGYTEDTDINLMRWDSKPKRRQVRFDRVLIKAERWAASDVELLGTEPISPDLPRVFPSDHFGVWCRLVRQGPAPADTGRPTLLDRWKGLRWNPFRSSR